MDQLNKIIDILGKPSRQCAICGADLLIFLGTPSEETITRVGSQKVRMNRGPAATALIISQAQAYIRSLPIRKPTSLEKLFPDADSQGTKAIAKDRDSV